MNALARGTPETGLDVFRHQFDERCGIRPSWPVSADWPVSAPPAGPARYARFCGGGYHPHRYRPGSGFLNPSVYCADLYALIVHIHDRVAADPAGGRPH